MERQAEKGVDRELVTDQNQKGNPEDVLHQGQTGPYREPHQAEQSGLSLHKQITEADTDPEPDQDTGGQDQQYGRDILQPELKRVDERDRDLVLE